MPLLRTVSRDLTLAAAALVLSLVPACGAAGTTPGAGGGGVQKSWTAGIEYEVTPLDGGARLAVVADVPAKLPAAFRVDPAMTPWLRDLEVAAGDAWAKVPFDGDVWKLPGCEGGCRVRYEIDLAGGAREMEDVAYAAEHAGAYLAPPSTWLLYPAAEPSGVPFRFHVATSSDVQFVTGVFPAAGATRADTYGADVSDLPESPYSVFGRFERVRLPFSKGDVDVAVVNGPLAAGNAPLVRWVDEGAKAVSAYYGRFPVRHAAVIVLVEEGEGIGYATTLGNGGGAIVARVGRDVSPGRLLRSWMMTHEMLHLAFPNLPRKYRWLEEGMATYVEPVVRARAGALTEEAVWGPMLKGLFFARPLPGEGGLDDTPTWGRIYWGGALFCLLADVKIREQTGNTRSLDDALRGILDQGGNVSVRWDLQRALRAGDEATGTTVLRDLHAEMGLAAVDVDLAELWARLGIRSQQGQMVFDDGAPLAAIRKAITAPPRPSE